MKADNRRRAQLRLVVINLATLAICLRTFASPHPSALARGLAVVSATCALVALALYLLSNNHDDQ